MAVTANALGNETRLNKRMGLLLKVGCERFTAPGITSPAGVASGPLAESARSNEKKADNDHGQSDDNDGINRKTGKGQASRGSADSSDGELARPWRVVHSTSLSPST